jgi:hypothetical protein
MGSAAADLRAERRGRSSRVYHVSFVADDGRGGQCTGAVSICVPGGGATSCADQAASVDSTAPSCTGSCAAVCRVERELGQRVCAGEAVPKDIKRLIARARRLLARGAGTAQMTARVGAAIRSIDEAGRMTASARASGRISMACGDSFGGLLSDARATAEHLLATP